MSPIKIAKVFQSGNCQAVRIPKEFHIIDGELAIEKIGHTILLFPKSDPWVNFVQSLHGISDDFFADDRHQPDLEASDSVFDEE